MAGLWLADDITSWNDIWSHDNFLTAVRLRLGLPHNAMHDIRKCVCGAEVDHRGLHHLQCKTAGNLIIAHNTVRDTIGNLCHALSYTVQWESARELLRTDSTTHSQGSITYLVL